MDIHQKKTALDDDSILYQKRDDSVSKKDLSSLSGRQKLQYFKDYYLKFCLLAVFLLVICVNLIYTIFFRHEETILNITAVNDTALSRSEEFNDYLKEYFQVHDKNELLTVNNYYLDDPNQQMAFTTKLVTGDLDLIICDRETFEAKSAAGFFSDLSELLPENVFSDLSSLLVNGQIQELDDNNEVISTGPATPFGIDISQTALYTYFGGSASEAILSVPAGSEHTDSVIQFITLLSHWTPDNLSSQESASEPAELQ